MALKQRFDTLDLPPSRRLDAWNDRLCASFVNCAVDASRDFNATYESLAFGSCRFSRVRGEAAKIQLFSQSSLAPARRSFALIAHDKGVANYQTGGQNFCVDQSEFVFIDMSNRWSVEIRDDDKDLYKLLLPQTDMLRLFPDAAQLSGARFSRSQGAGALLNSVWSSVWRNSESLPQETNQLLLNAIQLLVSTSSAECGTGHHRLLPKIVQFIDQHIADDDLSTRKIAQRIHASERTVQLAFAQMKTTPSQFIRDRRMELAAKSLRIERHRIADIAYDLGYSDLSLFSRHFKAHFKVAPRDYRRNHA